MEHTTRLVALLCLLLFPVAIESQSFLTAISQFPSLSNFTTLFYDNPGLANSLLSSNFSAGFQQTVLVPDNDAFTKFEASLGAPIGSLTVDELEPILQYHILVGALTSQNFTAPSGTTNPTFLTGPKYDNRTAGPALGVASPDVSSSNPKNGQVVFIQANPGDTGASKRFTVRQGTPVNATVQGGLGHKINMTAIDGYWDGGVFQIVDSFLTLPKNCTATMYAWKAFSLFEYMAQTGLGPVIDTTQNMTCLAPTDEAFLSAGTGSANITELAEVLLFHTIGEPLYSNFLEDGQEYTTLGNQTVRITIIDGQIYFNDALVLKPNVLTNNGLMIQIDRVMSPLKPTTTGSSSTSMSVATSATSVVTPSSGPGPSSGTVSATPSASASAKGVAASAMRRPSLLGWMEFLVSLLGLLVL